MFVFDVCGFENLFLRLWCQNRINPVKTMKIHLQDQLRDCYLSEYWAYHYQLWKIWAILYTMLFIVTTKWNYKRKTSLPYMCGCCILSTSSFEKKNYFYLIFFIKNVEGRDFEIVHYLCLFDLSWFTPASFVMDV